MPERGVDGETAGTAEAWPVTLSGAETTGEFRATAEEGLLSDLLRMLAMVKEVGVDFAVGEVLGLAAGKLFFCCSAGSFGCGEAICRVRGKEGICTCSVSALCGGCCPAGRDGKAHGRVSAGKPTPASPGRCTQDGYTDIIFRGPQTATSYY